MAEHTTQRLTIRAAPQACFDAVIDFERYPEWAADIKAVSVGGRDAEGRATQITFRAAAFGRSTTYTLAYDYSEVPSRLSWVQTSGDITSRLDGAYDFVQLDDGDTEVTYRLDVELRVPIPGFVKRRAETRITATALRELKSKVEGGVRGASSPS